MKIPQVILSVFLILIVSTSFGNPLPLPSESFDALISTFNSLIPSTSLGGYFLVQDPGGKWYVLWRDAKDPTKYKYSDLFNVTITYSVNGNHQSAYAKDILDRAKGEKWFQGKKIIIKPFSTMINATRTPFLSSEHPK